ncbi:MAG: hypothetical protein WBX17_02955, partial [Microbacterium sp.]
SSVGAATIARVGAADYTSSSFAVSASSQNSAATTLSLTSISAIGGNGVSATAVVLETATTSATVAAAARLVATGAVSVEATQRAGTAASAAMSGTAIGLVASISLFGVTATQAAGALAAFDGSIYGSASLLVRSTASGAATATMRAASGGTIDVTTASATAAIGSSASTVARYGSGVLVVSGAVNVNATQTTTATATTDSNGGGAVSFRDSTATATIDAAAHSSTAARQTFGTGTSVRATANRTVDAFGGQVGVSLGGGSSLVATARIGTAARTDALILPGAVIHAPDAAVIVEAVSTNRADSGAGAVGVGVIVNVGNSDPRAEILGATRAQMAAGIPFAASLRVEARSADLALASLESRSGGLIEVGDGVAVAHVDTDVTTDIGGGANAPIIVRGDAHLVVDSQPRAVSDTQSSSGGGVRVAHNAAVATNRTAVVLDIADGTPLAAGGSITLTARQNTVEQPGPVGLSFDAVEGVDTGTEQIVLSGHGLADLALITYDAQGQTPVGGLNPGDPYRVIVIDPNRIELGALLAGGRATGADDTLWFGWYVSVGGFFELSQPREHGLREGQRVIYKAPAGSVPGLVSGKAYTVKIVDEFRVQLIDAATPATPVSFPSSSISGDGLRILAANGYAVGAALEYVAPGALARFAGAFVEARQWTADDPANDREAGQLMVIDGSIQYFGTGDDSIAIRDHGLTTGREVWYQATSSVIGGLSNERSYWVIAIDGNRIRLADSYCEAVGFSGDSTCFETVQTGVDEDDNPIYEDIPIEIAALVLAAQYGADTIHTLYDPLAKPVLGLRDGQRYYVVARDDAGFSVSASAGGAAIVLAAGGGTSSFRPAVVDLGDASIALGDKQRLAIDLTADGTGTQQFVPGTVELALAGGGEFTESFVDGGGGGFISTGETEPSTTVSADVDVIIGDGAKLRAGGDVDVLVSSHVAGNAEARSRSGGAIDISSSRSRVNAEATTDIVFGAGSEVDAGGSVNVLSLTRASGKGKADTKAGGFGTGVSAWVRLSLIALSTVTLNGRITTGDDIRVSNQSAFFADAWMSANSASVGGAASGGECDIQVNDGRNTGCHTYGRTANVINVGGAAWLEGDDVSLRAALAGSSMRDEGYSRGEGLGQDADARAQVRVDSASIIDILSGAKIIGRQSITLTADQGGEGTVDLRAHARASCGCLGGDTDADSRVTFNGDSRITAHRSAMVKTAALLVQALQSAVVVNATSSRSGAAFDGGSQSSPESASTSRTIQWSADVILHSPTPLLVIDEDGRVVELHGLTASANGSTLTVGSLVASGAIIEVAPIENDGGGEARFIANHGSHPAVVQRVVYDGVAHDGTWRIQSTFDSVTIHNHSDRELHIDRISVANLDANPAADVDIVSPDSEGFRFRIAKPLFPPTLIDIANLGTPGDRDLVLEGLIDNPIGTTTIVNDEGDVLAAQTGAIRTNIARLDAPRGTIGRWTGGGEFLAREQIDITLVQSDYLVDDVDPTRPVSLIADAADDVVLDITYIARMTPDSPYIATAFAPQLGPIHAGRDIDIVVHDSLTGVDRPSFTAFSIHVEAQDPGAADGDFEVYYYPDQAWPGFDDPVLIAWGTANEPADSAYVFSLAAGNDIQVVHAETATTISILAFTDVDATLVAMRDWTVPYSTTNGDGEITMLTNGLLQVV